MAPLFAQIAPIPQYRQVPVFLFLIMLTTNAALPVFSPVVFLLSTSFDKFTVEEKRILEDDHGTGSHPRIFYQECVHAWSQKSEVPSLFVSQMPLEYFT